MERLCRNIDVSGWDISAAEWPRIHTRGVALKITGTVPKASQTDTWRVHVLPFDTVRNWGR